VDALVEVELQTFSCLLIARNQEMEQKYLSDDGDMGIRQNWARGIHSKWTIT
jgi:hypothetical protein